jgi:integrase
MSWLAVAPATDLIFDMSDRSPYRPACRQGRRHGPGGLRCLRSGCATQAARNNVAEWKIQRHLRHTSPIMTRRYIHEGNKWKDSPMASLGL